MIARIEDFQQTLPARLLRPDETELVADWLAAAGDVSSAYVSKRRTDEPAIYRRIVISVAGNVEVTHLIHASSHNGSWFVLDVGYKLEVHEFDTLLDALNFVRPVLLQSTDRSKDQRCVQDQGRQAYRLPAFQRNDGYGLVRRRFGDDKSFDVT
jgi:hypothetical protein